MASLHITSNMLSVYPESSIMYTLLEGMVSNVLFKDYFIVAFLSVFTMVLLMTHVKLNRKFKVLYKIPGPPGLPLLGHIIQIVTTKDIPEKFGEYARQFPNYYRAQIGPFPAVVLTSPQSIEKLLSSNSDGHLSKADEYSAMADYLDEGLITSCGEKWRTRRKLFAPLFSYKCFPHFLDVFNRHSKVLIQKLDEMFLESEINPIQVPLYESLLRIICEISMDVELNDTSDEFNKFFEEAEKTKEFIFRRMSRPWYRVEWIWKFHPFRREYEENMKYIKGYMLKVVQEGRKKYLESGAPTFVKGTGKHKTVMDVLLENALSDSDIREEAHTAISAGHETTGAALQFALMLLAENPEHQILCQTEIDQIIRDESKCPDGNFTLISLAELKYTERCIKETLRLYPVANMTGRKLNSPLRIDKDMILPSGTTCMVVCSDVHMNPEIYPEPTKFDPSRFTPENCIARHPYAYIPFSAGPRMCLGQKFAIAQMKLILGRILHHFTVETTDKLEAVPLQASVVLTPIRGYNFILKRRSTLVF